MSNRTHHIHRIVQEVYARGWGVLGAMRKAALVDTRFTSLQSVKNDTSQL